MTHGLERPAWRRWTRKLLLVLGGLAVAAVVALVVLLGWPLPEMPRARGGRIEAIDAHGANRRDSAGSDLTVVDGSGRFLIPGLWDMHVHSLKISPQYTHPLWIANGITGVPHAAPGFYKARNADEARALVEHVAAGGADLLKIYTHVSPAAHEVIAAESSKRGLRFAGHLPVRVPLRTAMAAGQQSVEHPRIFLFECFRGADELRALPNPAAATTTDMRARFIDEHDGPGCSRLMQEMAASNTWWTPTLQVLRMSALADRPEFRDDPRGRYIPFLFWSGLWQWDADHAAARAKLPSGRHVDAELYRLALDNVRQAHRAGVRFVAGTDSGDTYVFPGFSIHDELAEMVHAGFTPAQALRSATLDAARFSGQERDFGSIEVGKVADMVLLEANPLADIRSTSRIAGLFFNARYLDRAALDSLLAFAEAQAAGLRTNLQLIWGALRSPIVWAQAAD
jgi:hypothetical protein